MRSDLILAVLDALRSAFRPVSLAPAPVLRPRLHRS
jgi:hypothetical protein